MISAVVLVTTDFGTQDKLLESLKLVNGVEEAHALYEVYDLLINIKGKSIKGLPSFSKISNTM
jgi:hypothetical protein